MKYMRQAALGVLLATAIFSSVQAQEPERTVYLGPQVGLYTNDIDDDDINTMIGAAVRFRMAEVLALEGSLNYRQDTYRDDSVSVKSWPVMATAMFYPVPTLYGAFGFGWFNTSFDRDDNSTDFADDTDSEIGWHFGGGVELPLGTRSILAGDIRYVFLDYEFNNPPGLGDSVDDDFYIVTIGVLVGL